MWWTEISKVKTTILGLLNINSPYNHINIVELLFQLNSSFLLLQMLGSHYFSERRETVMVIDLCKLKLLNVNF